MNIVDTLKRLLDTENQAVASVISVILMVAITVILASVVAVFALGFSGTTNTAPSAAFSFDLHSDTANVTVFHAEGKELNGDQLRFAGAALEKTRFGDITEWSGSEITAGSSALVSVRTDDTLRVIWQNEDKTKTAVLGKYSVPDGPWADVEVPIVDREGTNKGSVRYDATFEGTSRAYIVIEMGSKCDPNNFDCKEQFWINSDQDNTQHAIHVGTDWEATIRIYNSSAKEDLFDKDTQVQNENSP